MQNIYAKKVTKRPIDDRVKHTRDTRYGITNTNGETWRTQRKIYTQFMKVTGFEKSRAKDLIEDMWPKIRQSLIAQKWTKLKCSVCYASTLCQKLSSFAASSYSKPSNPLGFLRFAGKAKQYDIPYV